MRYMSSNEIRNMFLNYFKERNHQIIESASLIPYDDKSLLWVNAGVTPLKKYFDGTVVPSNRRMTSCQKCLRTGDIDSVGKTSHHHTFFEMLGNFSIGDYFKDEALTWAMELLTSPKYFGFDKEKLYVNEINVIPGALSYYLFEAKDIYFDKLLDDLISEGVRRKNKERELILSFKSDVLNFNKGKK